jgi:U3 small nucleolar RNA-associated protein 3
MEGWGDSKQDYYGADEIDTEQAALEEETEAKRLQQKHLEAMAEDDFGFGEGAWEDDDVQGEDGMREDGTVTEVLPQLQIPENLGPEERLKVLKSRYPEFEPIAKEFVQLQGLHVELKKEARLAAEVLVQRNTLQAKDGITISQTHAAIVKYQALSTYLGTTAMYFAVLSSTADGKPDTLAKSPLELRDHPIMKDLVESRQLWNKVQALPVPDPADELAIIAEIRADQEKALSKPVVVESKSSTKNGIKPTKKVKKAKKTTAELEAELAQAEAEVRRAERMQEMEKDLASLSALTTKPSRKVKKSTAPARLVINEGDSDIGDETELTAHELAEKANRKRSLKFYTAQITQKANKRGVAGKDAGGDMDIPHRERLKDRQARLNVDAEKRGKKALQPDQELGGESDEEDHKQARAIRGEDASEDGEDYYELISARSKQKKEEKRLAAEAYAQAEKEGAVVHKVEEVGVDGKRKISYQIEKNKGLTPHRKKESRNPRTKKRKQYEDKQKKLSSQKAVWKGGEGKGMLILSALFCLSIVLTLLQVVIKVNCLVLRLIWLRVSSCESRNNVGYRIPIHFTSTHIACWAIMCTSSKQMTTNQIRSP